MYIVSDKFVEYSREYGRQIHSRLIMDNVVLQDEVISLSKSFDGDLYRTVMQELKGELDGRFDLTDKVIRFQFGLSLNDSAIEWIDYGNFIVKEHDRIIVDKNEDKTTLLAYDSMLLTHILYDAGQLNVTYPISLFNLYKAIATVCGLDVMETSIPNGSMMINEDKWTNIEDVTYRNILDEISQITGTSIIINDNKLQCKQYEFVKNLIKDDFSDFTAYQGATVTKNKTFPIDVFKGGRNYFQVNKINRQNGNTQGICYVECAVEPNSNYIASTDAPIGVPSRNQYDVFVKDTLSAVSSADNGFSIGRPKTVRSCPDGKLYVYMRRQLASDGQSHYKDFVDGKYHIKLEKGSTATPYSPAPEDGYGYTGDDGAWHIQTSGGANNLKCLRNTGFSKLDVTHQNKVNIVAWENMRVGNNFSSATRIPLKLNELNEIVQVSKGDGTTLLFMTFQTLKPSDSLDFIASDPMIYVNHATDNNTIDEVSMRSLKIDERVKPFNILNLTREQAHDNYVYPQNWETIPVNNRSEIVFADNQIMDKDRETFAQPVFNRIKDVTFTPFQSEPVGTLHMQPLDFINVVDMNNVSHSSLLSTQSLMFNTGSRESVSSLVPKTHKSKYALVTDNRRAFMRAYFLVDQQNGIIEGLIQQIDNVAEATARLTIRVDSIETEVSQVHNGNIINGLNGENDYVDWIGGSNLVYGPGFPHYAENIRYNHGFFVGRSTTSLSESFISFINSGFDISPRGFVVPDTEHSYRGKVEIFKPFSIDLLEYNSSDVLIKTTNHNFPTSTPYVQFTNELTENTMYVRLRFNHENARWNDRIRLTDQMFNRGQPKDWFASAENAMVYSQTTRTQLSDRIDDVVSTVEVIDGQVFVNKTNITQLGNEIELKVNVDGVISAINLTSEQAKILANHISLEGLTTINGNFKVLPNGDVEFINAKGTNVNLSGKITTNDLTATGGTIGGFTIYDDEIKGEKIALKPSQIDVGDVQITSTADNNVVFRIPNKYPSLFINNVKFAQGNVVIQNSVRYNSVDIQGTNITPPSIALSGGVIGLYNHRYGTIYLDNQPNVASDTRYKSSIQDIDPLLVEIIGREVKPKQYRTQFDDKIHFGYIAQDVERALYKYCGHDKDKYAMLSKDESYMSLLYGELNVIIEAYNRLENERLEERIKALEGAIYERTSNSR